jgi:hypothetical protein
MARTEDDKVLRSPITVTLGGAEHSVPLLVIKDAREWRKRFAKLVSKLPAYAGVTTDDAAGFDVAVNSMLVSMPDEMADLFFAYAKDLDRDAIEDVATEAELARAIEQVIEIAFPLVGSLTGALGKMAPR